MVRDHDEDKIYRTNEKHRLEKTREFKSNSFVSGVLILTISNLLVKMAGLLFKIPMNYIVGDTGMGYYNSAYSVYTFFYMLSTSGLPIAISVMVSENRSKGKIAAAKLVYRIALILFIVLGLGACILMVGGASSLAGLIKSDGADLSIAVIAPTMFFICISSAIRGYFQGCGNMVPTAISQLIEAIGKLVIGVAAASYAIRQGYGISVIAAYAASGLTIGSIGGWIYLAGAKLVRRDRDLMDGDSLLKNDSGIAREVPKKSEILARFVKISLPVTLSSSVMSLTNMIDTALIQRILQSSGMTEETAATLYGNYTSLAVPMFNLPPVFVYPIAYSLVPAISAALASKNIEEARVKTEVSLRYAVMIGLPCALGMSVLADPILCLFYKESSAHLASPLLTYLAPSSFFVCILAVTNSVLQGSGKEKLPVISMLCGAVVKCVSSVVLLNRFGIVGAPISTFICYLTVTVMNITFVAKTVGIELAFVKTLFKPLAASLLCAFTAASVYNLLQPLIGIRIACAAAILMAVAVYAGVILVTGAVTREEIRALIGRRMRKT